jgi:predicted transcriptional regulator
MIIWARELRRFLMADDSEQLGLATELTVAWLANPHTRAQADDAAAMLGSMLMALRSLRTLSATTEDVTEAEAQHTPATTKRKSLASPDHIISMINGKRYRTLTRHLRTHGLTPYEYRHRYGLNADYPMTAPGYIAERSAAAKQRGLGRKPAPEAKTESALQAAGQNAHEPVVKEKRRRLGIAGAKQAAQAHLGTDDSGPGSRPTGA